METQVLLDCKVLGIEQQPFPIQQAEALLNYQLQKGFTDWELSAEQGYTFTNGIIARSNKGENQESSEQRGTGGRRGS